MDYYLETLVSRVNLDAPGARAAVLERLRALLVTMDFLDQDRYVQKLATLMRVGEDSIKLAIRGTRSIETKRSSRPSRPAEASDIARIMGSGNIMEEKTLAFFLKYSHLKELMRNLQPTVFSRAENREIFLSYMNNPGLDEVRRSLPETSLDHFDALASWSFPPIPDDELESALTQCIRRLEERRLKDLKIQEKHFLSEESLQDEETYAIQRRALEVNTRLKELFERERQIPNPNEAGAR